MSYCLLDLIYLTNWIILIVLFHTFTHRIMDLHLLTLFAFVGGSYVFYVKPKYLPIYRKDEMTKWRGWKMHMTHFFKHLIPLVFIIWAYGFQKPSLTKEIFKIIPSIGILIIYATLIDVQKVYHIHFLDVFWIVAITFVLYAILFRFK